MALYPPVIASSMPAFNIKKGKVKVYFTLPIYNSINEINQVHLTLRYQSNNVNALRASKNEIMLKSIHQDQIDKGTNKYYIQITSKNIKDGFKVDTLYKVQIRFCNAGESQTTSNNKKIITDKNGKTFSSWASFFREDTEYFSEWSTVCLIKPVYAPQFYIDNFYYQGINNKINDKTEFITYNRLADFIGIYNTKIAEQEESSQILKSWSLTLIDQTENKTIKSGDLLASAYNYTSGTASLVLQYSLPYEFKEHNKYTIIFSIITRNGYTDSISYNFSYINDNSDKFSDETVFKTFVNEEEGYIRVKIGLRENDPGSFILRRSDSKSDFLNWEDLKYFSYLGNISNQDDFEEINYYDFTAESGIAYRYRIQKIGARGRRGDPEQDQISKKGMATIGEWESAFLLESTGNGDIDNVEQLKLKYDFQLSSLNYNISESKTDTIGSKYPYIRRNGNTYYRSFPCSGTITAFMDRANLFTSKSEINNNYSNIYDTFKGNINQYSNQYDFTYERKFREKVQEFLYNSKPKLFKSLQEGNIFVKLMDISLSPKQQLSRLIYTFSATAYQIGPANIQNYVKNDFIQVGSYDDNIRYEIQKLGHISELGATTQPYGITYKANQDIIGAGSAPSAYSIASKYNYNKIVNNRKVVNFYLTDLTITVNSDPKAFVFDTELQQYLLLEDFSQTTELLLAGQTEYVKWYGGNYTYPTSTNITITDISSEQGEQIVPQEEEYGYVMPAGRVNPLLKILGSTQYTYKVRYPALGTINVYKTDCSEVITVPLDNYDVTSSAIALDEYGNEHTIYFGNLFLINDQEILISPPNNIYHLSFDDNSFNQNSTIIPVFDTNITLDYAIHLTYELAKIEQPKITRVQTVIGQLDDNYTTGDLINKIENKYSQIIYNSDNSILKKIIVDKILSVEIQAQPGVIVKSKIANQQQIFRINETGVLKLDSENSDYYITELKIYTEQNEPTNTLINYTAYVKEEYY